MIEQLTYSSIGKKLMNISKGVIFGCSQFRFNYPYRSSLAKKLRPIVAVTCYKWRPYPSIYHMGTEERKRQEFLMNKLKIQCKEVPVIRARKFNNACYIPGLDELKSHYTDDEWKELCQELCREWGMELDEFMNAVGPHIVILGDAFANAPTLAHEFGHYLNTIGKGEAGGQRAHEQYTPASINANKASLLAGVGSCTGIIAGIKGSYTIAAIGFATSSGAQIAKIFVAKPIIKAETAATTTGLKNLKLAGASDHELSIYKDDLMGALDTYKTYYKYMPALKATSRAALATLSLATETTKKYDPNTGRLIESHTTIDRNNIKNKF